MSNKSLTHFFVAPAFRHLTPADLMKKARDYMITALQELSQFTVMVQTYQVDKELRSVMKEDAHRAIGDEARERGGGAIFATAASIGVLDTRVLIQIRSKGSGL